MPNRRTSKNLAHRARLKLVKQTIDQLTNRRMIERFRRDMERFWEREYMSEVIYADEAHHAKSTFKQEYAAQSEAQEAQSYYPRSYFDAAREATESNQGDACQDK